MFFSFGIAYSLELIALVFGIGLLIFLHMHKQFLNKYYLFVAWLVIVISSISIICTTAHTIRFWTGGYYKSMMMMHKKMMKRQLMENQNTSMTTEEATTTTTTSSNP